MSTGAEPSSVAVAPKARSFFDAPTVMADGAVPGELIVLGSGPSLPAAITTMTPRAAARSRAATSISSSMRVASSAQAHADDVHAVGDGVVDGFEDRGVGGAVVDAGGSEYLVAA